MHTDYTHVTVVLDRSGSMRSCRTDAEGGLNQFIDRQKEATGDTTFTLVQFDDTVETVYNAVPIKQVGQVVLYPRGGTALLDAVGKAIVETGKFLHKMQESDRPGLVIVVIVTDGEENASEEYTKGRIKEMIEHQQKAYNWQFTFLGANHDAFHEAAQLGIRLDCAAQFTGATTRSAYNGLTASVARMRSATSAGQPVVNSYTKEEREEMSSK